MQGYRIVSNDIGYHFELLPHNNKNQPIGWSRVYLSKEECEQAAQELRSLIIINHIDSIKPPYTYLSVDGNKCHVDYCLDGTIIFSSRDYNGKVLSGSKTSARNIVKSIFNNNDKYFKKM